MCYQEDETTYENVSLSGFCNLSTLIRQYSQSQITITDLDAQRISATQIVNNQDSELDDLEMDPSIVPESSSGDSLLDRTNITNQNHFDVSEKYPNKEEWKRNKQRKLKPRGKCHLNTVNKVIPTKHSFGYS